jgi:biopolymer transport protein ExbD
MSTSRSLSGLGDAAAPDDQGPISSINIIPFVDIALVLLVIFMLTSATIVRGHLQVELPRAAAAGAPLPSTLAIVCTRTGALLLDGQPVASAPDLARLVSQRARLHPGTQALIAADQGVAYGKVVELIDLVKRSGIVSFALDVERGELPPGGR